MPSEDCPTLTLQQRAERVKRLTDSVDHPAELTPEEQRLVAEDMRAINSALAEIRTPLSEFIESFNESMLEAFQPLFEFAEQFDFSPSGQKSRVSKTPEEDPRDD